MDDFMKHLADKVWPPGNRIGKSFFFITYQIFQMILKKLFCHQHSATSFVEEVVLVKPKMATRSGHTGTISALISTQTLNLAH